METSQLILVVDDQVDAGRALQRLLKFRGHDAQSVSGGPEALAFLEKTHTDLVVLDVMMPEMDGITVLKTIRKNPQLDHTKVIMFSASDNKDTQGETQRLGAIGFILKGSLSGDRLLSQIESFLA